MTACDETESKSMQLGSCHLLPRGVMKVWLAACKKNSFPLEHSQNFNHPPLEHTKTCQPPTASDLYFICLTYIFVCMHLRMHIHSINLEMVHITEIC